jgi:hypothetical protein
VTSKLCVVVCVVTLPSLPKSERIAQGRLVTSQIVESCAKTSINTLCAYYSGSFDVASSEIGTGFDTVEVSGSNPLVCPNCARALHFYHYRHVRPNAE